MRVLVADDHALVREAVASYLTDREGFEIQHAGSLQETLDALAEDPVPDVVLLDLVMPGMDGMSSIHKVLEHCGPARLVIFSGSTNHSFVAQAIEVGVRGFMPKTMSLRSIGSALRMVRDGEVFVPSAMFTDTFSVGTRSPARDGAPFTTIEAQVLKLAATGKTNKEIAVTLQTTEVLVKMYMRSICKKVDARNRTHAAMRARELGRL
jgi:two-component system nitrate/nitrite response regulator NarP